MNIVERHFRPEFLNRLDDIIVFRPLTKDDLKHIVEIEFGRVAARLADRGIGAQLTAASKEFLIEKGYSPEFGARPLRRAIEHHIEDPLAEELLRQQLPEGTAITVRTRDDHLYFDTTPASPTEDQPEQSDEPAEAAAP
jgi:ATP-dependent Clp protease ATP-binding subunit ClpC